MTGTFHSGDAFVTFVGPDQRAIRTEIVPPSLRPPTGNVFLGPVLSPLGTLPSVPRSFTITKPFSSL
jgi:hypothetical protein